MTKPERTSVDNLHRIKELLFIASDYIDANRHPRIAKRWRELFDMTDAQIVLELKAHAEQRAKTKDRSGAPQSA